MIPDAKACEKCNRPSGPLPRGEVRKDRHTGFDLCGECWFSTDPALYGPRGYRKDDRR